jgi:hypothetical protein
MQATKERAVFCSSVLCLCVNTIIFWCGYVKCTIQRKGDGLWLTICACYSWELVLSRTRGCAWLIDGFWIDDRRYCTYPTCYCPSQTPIRHTMSSLLHLRLLPQDTTSVLILAQVKVKVTLRLSVSQSVCLGVEPRLGLMTRCFFLLKVTVLSMWGALSDERSGLSFVSHSR